MENFEKAIALARAGYAVFPLQGSIPIGDTNGHLDATTDEDEIKRWWAASDWNVGINVGMSDIVVLDIDCKNGKNGFETLEANWLIVSEDDTFWYDTPRGGRHMVYRAPDETILSPAAPYRKLEGIDRRGGSSYVVWWGDRAPAWEEIAPAPEWLCDPAPHIDPSEFAGDLEDWMGSLVKGAPSKLVRDAIDRIPLDMGHGEMVAAQHNAVRLGAEGAAGVDQLLGAIHEAWMSRDPGGHSTPQDRWDFKFDEALRSGIAKHGEAVQRIKNLPNYDLGRLPEGFNTGVLIGEPSGFLADAKQDYRVALRALCDTGLDDDQIASLLWSAPKTSTLSREWMIDLVYERIQKTRNFETPERDNPSLPDAEAVKLDDTPDRPLLDPAEVEAVALRPGFVEHYMAMGRKAGFVNEKYFRASAWQVLSMALGFRGFIPVSGADKMGLNLWNQVLGYSGTGKTRATKFRDAVLNLLFDGDNPDTAYSLGSDSSPQGLQTALLQRDRQVSFLGADEASRFFKQLAKTDWMSGFDDVLSHYYEGRVDPSSKLNLKELRGKSALTSFNVQMFATPDRLTEVLNRDMFLTGFLARFSWTLGDPPLDTDDRFLMHQQVTPVQFDESAPEVEEVVVDLIHAGRSFGANPRPILATDEALQRMARAYQQMYRQGEKRDNWDIIEPSITRLAETIRKCAALTAMYRGSDEISIHDALYAISAAQDWYDNLFRVATMISAGDFQRDCARIETWVRQRGGRVTRSRLYHQFGNMILKDPRELDSKLNFLVESGRINRKDESGKETRYELNGG